MCTHLAAGCSPCGRVVDSWTDNLRVEVSHVGVGDLADTGFDDHVRWIFGGEVIELLVEPLDEEALFAPSSGTATLDSVRTGGDDARVDLALRVVPRRVEALDDAELGPSVQIRFALDAVGSSLRYRTPREDVTWAVDGDLTIVVPLIAEGRDDGVDLVLVVDRARIDQLQLDAGRLQSLPEPPSDAVIDVALALSESLVVDMVDDAPGSGELLTVPALTIGGSSVQSVPSRFAVTGDGSLVVGLVTPLRPVGTLAATPSLVRGSPFAVEVHPGLPLALIRADLVDGAIPRRRGPSGEGATGGRFGVSVDAVTFRGNAITWSYRWWCLAGARCFRADLVGQSTVGLDAAVPAFSHRAPEMRGISPSSASFDITMTDAFVDEMGDRVSDLLSPGAVRVLGRWWFEPRAEELAASADRLRVAGDILLRRVDLLRPGGY